MVKKNKEIKELLLEDINYKLLIKKLNKKLRKIKNKRKYIRQDILKYKLVK